MNLLFLCLCIRTNCEEGVGAGVWKDSGVVGLFVEFEGRAGRLFIAETGAVPQDKF